MWGNNTSFIYSTCWELYTWPESKHYLIDPFRAIKPKKVCVCRILLLHQQNYCPTPHNTAHGWWVGGWWGITTRGLHRSTWSVEPKTRWVWIHTVIRVQVGGHVQRFFTPNVKRTCLAVSRQRWSCSATAKCTWCHMVGLNNCRVSAPAQEGKSQRAVFRLVSEVKHS